jgi:fluoride exporter
MTTLTDQQRPVRRLSRTRLPSRLLAAIFVGGMIGALARALLGRAFPTGSGAWPWATFTANTVGSLLLGYFTTRLQERLPPATFRRPLLGTGFCGALTTSSTFQVELLGMARDGDPTLVVAYSVTSVAVCFAAIYLASALTRRVLLR